MLLRHHREFQYKSLLFSLPLLPFRVKVVEVSKMVVAEMVVVEFVVVEFKVVV